MGDGFHAIVEPNYFGAFIFRLIYALKERNARWEVRFVNVEGYKDKMPWIEIWSKEYPTKKPWTGNFYAINNFRMRVVNAPDPEKELEKLADELVREIESHEYIGPEIRIRPGVYRRDPKTGQIFKVQDRADDPDDF